MASINPTAPQPKPVWEPNEGPQTFALTRGEKEILFGGSRGGGKTDCGLVFMLRPAISQDAHGNWQFPLYRGLTLRLQAEDLTDWVDRAEQLYSHFGAKKVGRPAKFEFPSGAIIYTNHLKDKGAYKKYQGHEYQLMNLEEATQIPEEGWYEMLLGSCRSTIPGLQAQIFLTANPGGPGHLWMRNRFVNVYDEEGRKIHPNTPFFVYTNKKITLTPTAWDISEGQGNWRIFVPSKIENNKYLANNKQYVAYLESLPENLKKAWRYGDWDAIAGQFFSEFRPTGPLSGDPAWANHVIPAGSPQAHVEPWWSRWGALDWGYDHPTVVLWGADNPNGQTHVYREFVARQLSPKQIGQKIAERSSADLQSMPEPHLIFYLDPSCYGKRDGGKLIPEQIMEGIDEALGLGTSRLSLLDGSMIDSNGKLIHEDGQNLLWKPQGRPTIILRPASNARKDGWLLIREYLRFRPLFSGGEQDEVLPKLQIHDCCEKLIECLGVLIHDEDNPEDVQKMSGDDPGDTLRYLLMSPMKATGREPIQQFVFNRLQDLRQRWGQMGKDPDPTTMHMVALKAEADWRQSKGMAGRPVVIPRGGAGGGMGRTMQAVLRRQLRQAGSVTSN